MNIIRSIFGISEMIGSTGLVYFCDHFLGFCFVHVKIFNTVSVPCLEGGVNKNTKEFWVISQNVIGTSANDDAALAVCKLTDNPAL